MSVSFEDVFNFLFAAFVGVIGICIIIATWFGLSVTAAEEWRWNEAKSLGLWFLWLVLLAPGTWLGINFVLWSFEFAHRNLS